MRHGHGEQYGFYAECNGKPLEGLEWVSEDLIYALEHTTLAAG